MTVVRIMTNLSSEDKLQVEHRTISLKAQSDSQATDKFGRSLVSIDPKEEARLRFKIDLGLIPLVSILYLLAFIDRANIGNARLAGLERDLNMSGYDFNVVLSVFYVSFIIFEIPSNTMCKWLGPGWVIPSLTVGFGILTICTAFVQSFSTLCAVRFILGIFEAGMLPCLVYYLSRWYRQSELTFRVSLFIISAALAGAFGGLLASAILTLDSFGSLYSWRMIFAIEGTVTAVVGLICLVALPDRPETAVWLTEREKQLCIVRLKSERVAVTQVIDKFSMKKIRLGILNPVVLLTSWIFLLNSITIHSVSFFLPTIIKSIYPDKSTTTQQLLTVPPYFVGAVCCGVTSYISWRINQRTLFMILCAPLSVVGYAIFLATSSSQSSTRYGAIFLPFLGIFTYGALTNSHISANVVSDTARASAIGTNVMFSNVGALVSTWAFLPFDGPDFRIGNGLNLASQATMVITAIILYLFTKRDNMRREQLDVNAELEGNSIEEIQEMDWKNPGFRWRT